MPRFDAFKPNDLADIHAREAALAEIECQDCGTIFRVAPTGAFADEGHFLSDMIRLRRVHYGDSPNIGCCAAGPTMNTRDASARAGSEARRPDPLGPRPDAGSS